MPRVHVISFGYLHGAAPAADIVVDLRRFRDPHAAAHLRYKDAHDTAVRRAVLNTPGVRQVIDDAVAQVRRRLDRGARTVTVAFGCNGGRHRAATAAITATATLGSVAHLEHRDIKRPVIERSPAPATSRKEISCRRVR